MNNKNQPTPNPAWEKARSYLASAKAHARTSVACQVLLGFELIQLKKELDFVQGGIERNTNHTEENLPAPFLDGRSFAS